MKIGDWPFKKSGVDCRTCLREPHHPNCPELRQMQDLDAYFYARMVLSTLEVGKPATRSRTSPESSRRGPRSKRAPTDRL
jgi:hypothetical protein